MAAGRWKVPEEDDALRELVAKGMSVTKTARAMGRSESAVFDHAKALGLSWNREPQLAAVKALKQDERARRAELRHNLMGDIEKLRRQLFSRSTVYNFGGKDNTFEEATLDQPAIADQLRLIQAVSAGIATVERLEAMDADSGVTDASGLLDQIGDAIKKAAADMESVL